METESPTRSRHPQSEPGSELGERNVRPRGSSELSEHRLDGDEEQLSTIIEGDASQDLAGDVTLPEHRSHGSDPLDAPMINPSQTSLHPQISASTNLTVLPSETGFDSMAQAVVHGSVDALPELEPDTFEASGSMAVFGNETRSFWFWVAPKPKDKSGMLFDELSSEDKKKLDASRFKEIDNLMQLWSSQSHECQRLRTFHQDNA